jgi:alpha-L-fucosidase 2
VNPEGKGALAEARRLVGEGKYREAEKLVSEKIMSRPLGQMPYGTVGELVLTFAGIGETSQYLRMLDLDTGVATTTFVAGGVRYTREVFASAPDQVICVRLSADQPGKVSCAVSLTTPSRGATVTTEGHLISLSCSNESADGIEGKLRFAARVLAIETGGSVQGDGTSLRATGADVLELRIAMATSHVRFDDVSGNPEQWTVDRLDGSTLREPIDLRDRAIEDHQKYFRRVKLDLGRSEAARLPTDERIRRSGELDDAGLAVLHFQYARYLLIACSRPGSQPANLQGVWNDSLQPPWGSKYTVNINTEMNYWPAETCNLAELTEPLVRMVEELSVTGARTARELYGARGWVCHHNTDLWRATGPIDGPNWGMWPTGGAWLCLHLWEHYAFGGDLAFLKRVYPAMKGAAEFFVDTLVEEPKHGWLVTSLSISPEHEHGRGGAVCAGPTMDQQILRDLFANVIAAAGLLGVDAEFAVELAKIREKLAPTQVGAQGQVQEWLEDWDATAAEVHHRHISHLYGLFPSEQIDPRVTPRLAEAARVTLNTRGDLTTGWAIAWRINCWARLLDGDRAHAILKLLLDPSRTYPNMFDAHPPFQIDGNFGGASGIAEMLLQSHGGEIHLLPALPKAWGAGAVSGLRARGVVTVDVVWKDAKVVEATLTSGRDGKVKVRVGGGVREVALKAGVGVKVLGVNR